MKYLLGIFNSDAVNKKGFKFPPAALASALYQRCLTGTPSSVGHDLHRVTGWARPIGLHFEPGLTRLFGASLISETEAESADIEESLNIYLNRHIIEETKDTIDHLRSLLTAYLNGQEKPFAPNCTALLGPGLAQRAFSDIFSSTDKDGLVSWSDLAHVGNGCFRVGELVFFAHPFFRRSLSRINNTNVEFFSAFQRANEAYSLKPRVALDPDMVGLASTLMTPIELEYVRGPKFSQDLKAIPLGVTVHQSKPFERYFSGVGRMEFVWGALGDNHNFECEELAEFPTGTSRETYGCRYVHSMVDEKSGKIIHLDGAIRSYEETLYIDKRLPVDIKKAGRHSEYTKLWRVDGDIPFDEWKGLIAAYFRNNSLVCEYFEDENLSDKTDPRATDQDERPQEVVKQYVPHSMAGNDGIRVCLSFLPTSDETGAAHARCIVPQSGLTMPNEAQSREAIEVDGGEVLKLLRRNGLSCVEPQGLVRVAFEDTYTAIPWIRHHGVDGRSAAETTLRYITELVEGVGKRGHDRVITFSVSWEHDSREVVVSVLGHVSELTVWLKTFKLPPADPKQAGLWADELAKTLSAYPAASDSPPLLATVSPYTGVFGIDRTKIPWEAVLPGGSLQLGFQLALPVSAKDLADAINEGRLTACPALILESKCSKCGRPYAECEHSKFLDDDVIQDITDMSLVHLFLTDRSAFKPAARDLW